MLVRAVKEARQYFMLLRGGRVKQEQETCFVEETREGAWRRSVEDQALGSKKRA